MLTDLFKRWMDMALWWLPKEQSETARRGETPTQPAAARKPTRQPTPETTVERVEPERIVERDDLTAIKGIGPAMQEKLQSFGIGSFRELATADAAQLTEKIKATQAVVSKARVEEWIAAARERS